MISMLLRCNKRNSLILLSFFFVGLFIFNKTTSVGIYRLSSANISVNESVEFDYLLDVLNDGEILLQSKFSIDGESYIYTRLFEMAKIGGNEFVINEVGEDETQIKVKEKVAKFDFFHTLQKIKIYKFSPEVLAVYSEDRFIFLKRT